MKQTDQKFSEFKKSLEAEQGRTVSDEEVHKARAFVDFLAKAVVDITFREADRQEKLKESPKGFHLEDGGTCAVCGQYAASTNSWYDKYGIKCMACQQAIYKKIIPPTLGKHKDSFYTDIELDIFFNLKGKVLNKFIKEGLLKVRIVSALDKGRHLRVFLLKDNKDFLPPKKLLSSHWVRDEGDGRGGYAFMPWYYFHDPKTYLERYRISDYLRLVPVENKQ